jgi:hypothetical protein
MSQSKLNLPSFDVVMAFSDDDSHWAVVVFTRETYRRVADLWPGIELDRDDEMDWWGAAFHRDHAVYMARIAVKAGLRVGFLNWDEDREVMPVEMATTH